MFPIFLKLERRHCLVVGAGAVAEGKIRGLLEAGASVQVVAPSAVLQIQKWASDGAVSWSPRPFEPRDLDGMFLAVLATSSRATNRAIFSQAHERGILCNAVDEPENCDFYYPAVVRRGDLQIAISTGGRSPALAQRLRQELEQQFGPEYELWVKELGEARDRLSLAERDFEARRRLLHALASREAFAARTTGGSN